MQDTVFLDVPSHEHDHFFEDPLASQIAMSLYGQFDLTQHKLILDDSLAMEKSIWKWVVDLLISAKIGPEEVQEVPFHYRRFAFVKAEKYTLYKNKNRQKI